MPRPRANAPAFAALAAVAIAALVACCATDVSAQSIQEGRITGTVRDATGGALNRASVLLRGSALIGGAKELTTDAEGRYRSASLAPGSYDLDITAEGMRTTERRGVVLPAGVSLVVDVTLEPGGVAETITVDAPSPLIDVTTAAASSNLSQSMLFHIPTDRALNSLVNLVPGVSAEVAFGGTQSSNNLQVDGLETTEPRLQDPQIRVNYNWIEEVQIAGLGAGAQWGGTTGITANSVLRSGSNRLSGLAEFYGTAPSWTANNTQDLSEQLQRQFASREIVANWDANAQVGGPLMRDRLWLFAGLQKTVDDGRPAGVTWSDYRADHQWRGIGKLTAAPATNVRLEGFLQGGRCDVAADFMGPTTPAEAAGHYEDSQVSWNTRAEWTASPRFVLDVRYTGWDSPWTRYPTPPATVDGPAPRWDAVTNMDSANVWYAEDGHYSRNLVTAHATQYSDRFLGGAHEFKFGAEFERTTSRYAYNFPSGRAYTDYLGVPAYAYMWDGNASATEVKRTTAFAQDTWSIGRRLTLSPGLRIDANRGRVPGLATTSSTTPVSPRFGIAWDLTSDHQTVLRAHYGRYTDPTFGLPIALTDGGTNPMSYYRILPTGEWQLISRGSGINRYSIGQDIRQPHVDQFVAGAERQIGADLSLQAYGIYRLYGDFLAQVDTTTIWSPLSSRDPGPDGILGNADDGAVFTIYEKLNAGNEHYAYMNPEDAWRRYSAVQIVARKRYSKGWQAQASYTWSKSWGTASNRWHSNASRFELGNPGVFVDPNQRINAEGPAAFDPTNEFKLLGSWTAPWLGGFTLGGVYRYNTGFAWGREAFLRGARQGIVRVKVEPRGTRREAPVNLLDLRAEKLVPLSGARKLGVFLDVFNVANIGTVDSTGANPVTLISGANFGVPQVWVDPRTVRAGARVTW